MGRSCRQYRLLPQARFTLIVSPMEGVIFGSLRTPRSAFRRSILAMGRSCRQYRLLPQARFTLIVSPTEGSSLALANATFSIQKINPSNGAIVQTISTSPTSPFYPNSLTYGGGYLWLFANATFSIQKINPSNGAIVQTISTSPTSPFYPNSLTYGGGYLWLFANATFSIQKINPSNGAIVQTISTSPTSPFYPESLTFEQQWAITTSSSPISGGSTAGVGSYDDGTTTTVTATPNSCFNFVDWTDDGTVVSTSPSYSFTVTANQSLVANFTPIAYAITTSASPSDAGTTSGGGNVNCGTSVNLFATANSCYTFANWTVGGTVVSSSPSYTFIASVNETVTANFVLDSCTIDTSSAPSAGGITTGGDPKIVDPP